MYQQTVNIAHWNARSILNKKFQLSDPFFSIPFICLSETFLSPSKIFNVPRYNIFRDDRNLRGGGIAILASRQLPSTLLHTNILLPEGIQLLGVSTLQFNLYTIYNANLKVDSAFWSSLLEALKAPYVLVGDFNAHHPLWGCSKVDFNGRSLFNTLEASEAIIINDGFPTRLNPPDQCSSVIYLAIVSPDLSTFADFEVGTDPFLSDHFPILGSLNLPGMQTISPACMPYTYRNFKSANWESFRGEVEGRLGLSSPSSPQEWTELIVANMDQCFPRRASLNFKRTKPFWWNQECAVANKNRLDSLRLYKHLPNNKNYLNSKKAEALYRRTISIARRSHFREFCNSINRLTPASEMWRKVKIYSRRFVQSPIINACVNPNLLEELLACLAPASVNIPDKILAPERSSWVPINEVEISSALVNKNNKSSPGSDDISYLVLKKLPGSALKSLCKLFNNILGGESLPSSWKTSIIIPIPKPGKNLNSPSGFRPIALSSCVGKTLETIVKNRLEWFLESSSKISPFQFGFRRSMGTIENLTIFYSKIYTAFSAKLETIAVYLDLSSAYDYVVPGILLENMISLRVPTYITYYIQQLLSDRPLFVKDKHVNKLVGPRLTNRGIPQGSVLSPILFNLYFNELPNHLAPGVQILQYADDVVIFTSGKNRTLMADLINRSLQQLNKAIELLGLTISSAKSSAMCFSRARLRTNLPSISIEDSIIPWTNSHKYLGIIFDEHLKWSEHVSHLKIKLLRNLNIIKAVRGVWWGGDPKTLLCLHNALIKSHLEYAPFTYTSGSVKLFNSLERIYHQSLRVIMGFLKTTPP